MGLIKDIASVGVKITKEVVGEGAKLAKGAIDKPLEERRQQKYYKYDRWAIQNIFENKICELEKTYPKDEICFVIERMLIELKKESYKRF